MIRKKNKYNKLLDRELIDIYKSNNEINALGELFARYTHLVASIALGILKDEQKAKDAVEEIFKIIIEDISNYSVKNFNALVYSTSKFHCFKIKNGTKNIGIENDFDEILDKELLLQKRIEILKTSLDKISYNQKKCVELYYFSGFSYSEIVSETKFSVKEVKSHIHEGKKNLKSLLEHRETS
ncbi:MAG: hypothetical protein CMP63_04700 [Flavobacteriales bacterium]|nr:hypothetical protein [Flavobacteriales bacterium]